MGPEAAQASRRPVPRSWWRAALCRGAALGLAAAWTDADVNAAAARCAAETPGGASGPAFVACVDRAVGRDTRGQRDRGYLELIRNFSCAQDDVGTLPLRTITMSIPDGYDSCEAAAAVNELPRGGTEGTPLLPAHPDFVHLPGVLPAGNEIAPHRRLTAEEAAALCEAVPECEGFTFAGESAQGPADMFLKSTVNGYRPAANWHTFYRKRPLTCPAKAPPAPEELRPLQVDVLREEPVIAVVRKFATQAECDRLVEAGGDWEKMSRAYTSNGGHSTSRRSYSANIYPPLKDPENEVTRLVGRMFSLTRNLTGYAVYPPGQEPVNGVLYKNAGDEYRPHCDGSCNGGMHRLGERVATTIIYCRAADKGGQTSFTDDALKVQPAVGDLLLFAYKYKSGRMTGTEAEHSGCPLRGGKKWIATQWYREGVTETWNWESANKEGSFR